METRVIYHRKIYDAMKEWKESSQGRTALLVEGARRVGKTTAVLQFARNEYRSFIHLDFSRERRFDDLWDDLSDLDYVFMVLQNAFKTKLHKRESLVIFDNVQHCPKARQAIKHLVEDGRYDYIETGSSISMERNVKDILIPSEESHIQMGPLDYEEFLWACGQEIQASFLRTAVKRMRPLGDGVHRSEMKSLRLYMLVGGMPQAVEAYLRTKNLAAVDKAKREILGLWMEELRGLDPSGGLLGLLLSIPSQLAAKVTGFRFSKAGVGGGDRRRRILVNELEDSKMVRVCPNVADPSAWLVPSIDERRFKLYLSDIGLLVTLCFWDKGYGDNDLYDKILMDKSAGNLGFVYENLVAVMLLSSGRRLFYHTFYDNDAHRSYEIDFLAADRNKICPIEVKSSSVRNHPSLDRFQAKYARRIWKRLIIGPKDLGKEGDIILLPVYLSHLLPEVFSALRESESGSKRKTDPSR